MSVYSLTDQKMVEVKHAERRETLEAHLRMRVVGQVRDDGSGAQVQILNGDGTEKATRPATQQEVMMWSLLAELWREQEKLNRIAERNAEQAAELEARNEELEGETDRG